jgi:hypothetical protein
MEEAAAACMAVGSNFKGDPKKSKNPKATFITVLLTNVLKIQGAARGCIRQN